MTLLLTLHTDKWLSGGRWLVGRRRRLGRGSVRGCDAFRFGPGRGLGRLARSIGRRGSGRGVLVRGGGRCFGGVRGCRTGEGGCLRGGGRACEGDRWSSAGPRLRRGRFRS